MHALKTPHATVQYNSDFTDIQINVTKGQLDLMDIKDIYAAFFRQWLVERIVDMKPDDVINLGYYVISLCFQG